MIPLLEIALAWLAVFGASLSLYVLITKSRFFNRTVETLTSDDEAVVERLSVVENLAIASATEAEEAAHRQRQRAKHIRENLPKRKRNATK